jgi:hypothetical protein
LFTTGYKRLSEGGCKGFLDRGFLMRDFDWLIMMLAGVSPPEQLSALRTLYMGFRKAKLKRTWDSASLMRQCKSEGKDSKRDYAKES